jgi:hypothetical protein
MSFTPNIPAVGQSLGNSRPSVNGNFSTINTTIAVNHVAMNAAGQGKHKFIQMPVTTVPSTAVQEIGLYTKLVNGLSRLFLRQENNGTEVQVSGVDPLIAATGYSFLPGGLLIQWGSTTTTGAGSGTTPVVFPTTFTTLGVNTNAYSVVVTANTGAISLSQNLTVDNVTHAGFDLLQRGYIAGRTVKYIAIGPKT